MAALDSALVSEPLTERPDRIKAGVDLGTAYTVLVALDGNDRPLAAAFEYADVVRDGVVTYFEGRFDLLQVVPVMAAHGFHDGVQRHVTAFRMTHRARQVRVCLNRAGRI